jgi:hypothetical protein
MNLSNDIVERIFKLIQIKQKVKYTSSFDSEQNYTVFYKQKYPYILINKYWYNYFKNV